MRISDWSSDWGSSDLFAQVAERKQHACQLRLSDGGKKIRLVLVVVGRAQQMRAVITMFDLRVVAGCDVVGAEPQGMLAKRRELHFPIAQHVRVRRLAGRVVGQKTCEYALTVFAREVDAMQRNIELVADRARILERSEEHTSELQSLMRISYAVFCLKKKNIK